MSDRATTRLPRSKAKELHCAFCGSTRDVELHHVGGRQHIAWFTIPLCRTHHERLTEALRQAAVNMSYTPDRRERQTRVRKAVLVFSWMLEESASLEQREKRR